MSYAINRVTSSKETTRVMRYAVVGVLSTAVDFAVLIVLKSLGWETILANSVAYSMGTLVSFTLSRRWTYPESRSKRMSHQFAQFVCISMGGLVLSNLVILALEPWLISVTHAPTTADIVAKIFATGIVPIWNFGANRLWTFNDID